MKKPANHCWLRAMQALQSVSYRNVNTILFSSPNFHVPPYMPPDCLRWGAFHLFVANLQRPPNPPPAGYLSAYSDFQKLTYIGTAFTVKSLLHMRGLSHDASCGDPSTGYMFSHA